eukprot:1158856-Pelagomonas_calceolata.AAC.4
MQSAQNHEKRTTQKQRKVVPLVPPSGVTVSAHTEKYGPLSNALAQERRSPSKCYSDWESVVLDIK